MSTEEEIHRNKSASKTYVGGVFVDPATAVRKRVVSKVFDSSIGFQEAVERGTAVLRVTPGGRQEVIAKINEGDRGAFVLTLQRYDSGTPSGHAHFSFVGSQITRLVEFLQGLKSLPIKSDSAFSLSDAELRRHNLTLDEVRQLVAANAELISQVLRSEITLGDVTALGYRRAQLKRFDRLLNEPGYMESEAKRLALRRPEDVWQHYFEQNKWIFGFGLTLVVLGSLEGRALEQVVQGASLGRVGKRADAVMKTRGLIASLCFVEIKRHDTDLLRSTDYRSGAFAPSPDLIGAVAQSHATVHAALTTLGERLEPTDALGNPTGEILYGIKPRSFVVVGKLSEFQTEHGLNEAKYRSFELYRRNLREPEIITFDELFHRASYIVEHEAN